MTATAGSCLPHVPIRDIVTRMKTLEVVCKWHKAGRTVDTTDDRFRVLKGPGRWKWLNKRASRIFVLNPTVSVPKNQYIKTKGPTLPQFRWRMAGFYSLADCLVWASGISAARRQSKDHLGCRETHVQPQAHWVLQLGDPTWNTVSLTKFMSKGRHSACCGIQKQSSVFRVASCVQDTVPDARETQKWGTNGFTVAKGCSLAGLGKHQ